MSGMDFKHTDGIAKPHDGILSLPEEHVLPRTKWNWPRDFKQFMAWIFAAMALGEAIIVVRSLPHELQGQGQFNPNYLLARPVFLLILALASARAWWTIWKKRRTARFWGICASLICILLFLRRFIIPRQSDGLSHIGAFIVGFVGLVTFLLPPKRAGF